MADKPIFKDEDSEVPERDMDEGTKKTGERKKSIMMIAGAAALGAFLGDLFTSRDLVAGYDGTYPNGFHAHAEYMVKGDDGGTFDLIHKDAVGNWAFGGDNSELYHTPVSHLNLNDPTSVATYGSPAYDFINNDYIIGNTGLGGAVGAGAGFVADWARKRRNKKDE
ncbi:MAG: hypothetical protein HZB68_00740 [Candidatus Aenigmarchaeota archaeon]|nr:hypothetical protein [Candidatus Aenigmarchaeota archaeon]